MKYKLLLIVLLCCCNALKLQATGQAGDRIVIGRDTLDMLTCPIEVDSVLRQQVSARLSHDTFNTGCWRGYRALWRIDGGELVLDKIVDDNSYSFPSDSVPEVTVDLNGIFDRYRDAQDRVVASWYSGELRVVSGKWVYYNHSGFDRQHECEQVFCIKQGKVTSQAIYKNSIKKGISSLNCLLYVESLFNGDRFPELKDTRLRADIDIRPKLDGSLDSLSVDFYEPEKIMPERKQLYLDEIKSCVSQVPQWDVMTLRDTVYVHKLGTFELWNKKGCKAEWRERIPDGCKQQKMDILSYNDTVYSLQGFPLQYDMNLYAKVKPYLKDCFSLDCFRGYIGCWKIEKDKLYLVKLLNNKDNSPLPLDSIFGLSDGKPMEASWYSGKLHLVYGNTLGDEYPLEEIYEKEVICEVNSGTIVSSKGYSNYFHPGDSDALEQCKEKLTQQKTYWSRLPELRDKDLDCTYWVYPKTDGTADSITIELQIRCPGECDSKSIKDQEHPFIKIYKEALQAVPKWDVLCVRNEIKDVRGWLPGKSYWDNDFFEERINLRAYHKHPVDKDPIWPDNIENIVQGNMCFPQGVPDGMPRDSVVVVCRFKIDELGYVDNAYVYGRNIPPFNNAALSIVYALPRIVPAQKDGKPISFEYELIIPFIKEKYLEYIEHGKEVEKNEEGLWIDREIAADCGLQGSKFVDFVGKQLHITQEMKSTGKQGKVVCKWVVEADGTMSRLGILRGLDPFMDAEAIRIMQTLPSWMPAKQFNLRKRYWEFVPQIWSCPVIFKW